MATVIDNDPRVACMYGEMCYRKNPDHLKQYKHPIKRKHDDESDEEVTTASKKLCPEQPMSAENQSNNRNDEFVVPSSVLAALCEKTAVPKANGESQNIKKTEDSQNEDKPLEPYPEVRHDDYPVIDSPEDVRLSIEQKFLLEMPDDFYQLWDLCTKLNKEKPEEALIKAGLTLVGPYDVLTGKLKNVPKRRVSTYLCHWRYYYDPPEFMTIIAGSENDFHMGYYRDDPFLMPVFVASMSSVKSGAITPLGENVFGAICTYINQRLKVENPFKKTALQRLQKEVESYALLKKLPLDLKTQGIRERAKEVVAKTFHGAGIVVPVDRKNDVGYRPLPETDANLRKILRKVVESKGKEDFLKNYDDVQEIITNVQFASDEGDYGMGLELGIDMFIFGGEAFHKSVFHLLSVAYELLGREPYIDIIQAHLQNRRKGSNMSILEVIEG